MNINGTILHFTCSHPPNKNTKEKVWNTLIAKTSELARPDPHSCHRDFIYIRSLYKRSYVFKISMIHTAALNYGTKTYQYCRYVYQYYTNIIPILVGTISSQVPQNQILAIHYFCCKEKSSDQKLLDAPS